MAVRFSYEQVVEATGARIRARGPRAAFAGVTTDSRAVPPGALFIALRGERFDGHAFVKQAVDGGAAGVVVSQPVGEVPGAAVFVVEDTLAALGELARFHRSRFRLPVGAVTGSNGKTTTKELVGAILATRGPALKTSGNLNNEVGLPLTLFGLSPGHVAAVVELGMNHAGEIERMARIAMPDAGLITTIQAVHTENFPDGIEGVARAKGELFRALPAGATMVVNLDDPRVVAQAQGVERPRVTFGRSDEAEVRLLGVRPEGAAGMVLEGRARGTPWTARVKLLGEHNAQNATGAFALGLALGVSPEGCAAGLEAARGFTQRLELIETAAGVSVLDDSYNANPSSMAAALATAVELAAGRRVVAVLGDMLELGAAEAQGHRELVALARARAAVTALFGPRFGAALAAEDGRGGRLEHFTGIDELLAFVLAEVKPHDLVVVKASRGMRLERVVAALTGQPGESH